MTREELYQFVIQGRYITVVHRYYLGRGGMMLDEYYFEQALNQWLLLKGLSFQDLANIIIHLYNQHLPL